MPEYHPRNSGSFTLAACLSRAAAVFLVCIVLLATAFASGFQPVHAKHGIVVSVHGLASQAGVEMMQAGGNAIDAAVATGFALAVVHPQAGNIGGGGFMLIRMADGTVHFLDYREKAPAAATANMYLDAQGNVVPGLSTIGYKAVGVPGSVAGMVYAQKKYGKLPLPQVMAPAIKLAREGFVLTREDAQDFRDKHLAEFPESGRIFQRDGHYYQPGDTFVQPELAHTLEQIGKDPDTFYHGALATALAAGIQKGGGLVTAGDLSHYEVVERKPVRGTYRGFEVISAPPPSSGGVTLLETLNILEGYDLAKLGDRSAASMHLTLEAFRRAYYDRAEFLGDPDFASIPVAPLIDKRYGAAWRESIDPQHATPSGQLRRPKMFTELDTYAAVHPQPTIVLEPQHTTHFSVVDAAGNAVAVTTTLNDGFGSRVVVPGLGFLLNDEMDDFSSKPGAANLYGLVQGSANAIGPNQRPLSNMTPTMVTHDGKLFLVLGSPGGARIITTVANVLMGVIDYGQDIQESVNAPRFHHQWLPDIAYVEQWFSPDTVTLLRDMGYHTEFGGGTGENWRPYWSDAECIEVDPATNERLGANDPRNNGKAIGY